MITLTMTTNDIGIANWLNFFLIGIFWICHFFLIHYMQVLHLVNMVYLHNFK
jgi:hypothetical protein